MGCCPTVCPSRHARSNTSRPIRVGDSEVWFLIVRIETQGGIAEAVSLGLTFVPEAELDLLLVPLQAAGFARVAGPQKGVICDALAVGDCCQGLLRGILAGRTRQVEDGEILAAPISSEGPPEQAPAALHAPLVHRGQHGNMSVIYDGSYILKTFRRVQEGVNPDLEIGRFLDRQTIYRGFAPIVGSIEYRRRGSEPITLGVLHRHVANQGTAWQFTVDQLSQYFERVAALPRNGGPSSSPTTPDDDAARAAAPRTNFRNES